MRLKIYWINISTVLKIKNIWYNLKQVNKQVDVFVDL